jgi:hypothetical protein
VGQARAAEVGLSRCRGTAIVDRHRVRRGSRLASHRTLGRRQLRCAPRRGHGVRLVWAPEGPGWPDHYANWWDAVDKCTHLTPDGHALATSPQNVWGLPTVDEAVRSMVYRDKNAGGVWEAQTATARYRTWPDKDSPLWKPHSQVIYWWTGTPVDEKRAYRIAYNGQVYAFPKRGWGDYWAYRCVCDFKE